MGRTSRFAGLAVVAALSVWPASARAQKLPPGIRAQPPAPGTPTEAPTPPTEPAPMPLPAAKPWQPLADRGLTLLLNYTGEAAANPVGGIRQDGAYAGQVFMGGNFDLDRMAAIPGAVLRAWVTNRHGDNLSAIAIGNNTSVQEIFGTQNTHLAVLTWQQKLLDEHLELEGGRTVANINFLSSPIYCNFQSNSTCGNPTFVFKTSNFTYFPASSWGAHARGWFTKSLYLHAGVYEVNPDRKRASDDGFNFSVRNATGVIAPFEVGYSTTFATDRLPRNYRLGGWYDAGDYSDPLKDEQGGLAILTGQPYATHNGRSGAFVRFDQMLWRPSDKTDRGLTVFGVAMLRVSGRVNEDYFLELGLLEKGTFRGRDEDTIGFMINDQKMSGLALENIRAARVAAGGSATLPSHQLMMELAYGAQLGPALRLSPNLQYIVNPDQMSVPSRTSDIPNAFVTGFKFTIDAPSLLSAPDG